jgi:hypothetical protein
MKTSTPLRKSALAASSVPSKTFLSLLPKALGLALCIVFACSNAAAGQTARGGSAKLPAPDKIVGAYVKAVGGKKRLAALRDATYDWSVRRGDAEAGRARTQLKWPSSARTDIILGDVEVDAAANPRSAWVRESDGHLRTLTGGEAFTARLQALLDASRFADYKKQNVLARTVAQEDLGGESAYVVEFSTRAGARLRYWFGVSSKLPLQMSDEARSSRVRFGEWRASEGSPLLLEPHRLEIETAGRDLLVLTLRESRYNTGLSESVFDPPGDASLDIPVLLRDLARNQDDVDRRVNEYTFMRKITERELNDRGEVKKEKVNVYEVYPYIGSGWIQKHVSENGVPLTPERAAKEEKRVAEELEKAERNTPKVEAALAKARARREAKKKEKGADAVEDDDEVNVSTFLRACEFVSPRRERFQNRDTIVFDFRVRPGFRPKTRGESLISKLAGVIWVDPSERQVMRLEARLVEGFKMGGGLVASIKPGAAMSFEQTRLPDGVWLPRFSQVNVSARMFLFAGMTINQTNEFSDYKRFSAKVGEDKLDTPKQEEPEKP